MPTASEELRDRMGELFGHRIDDSGPINFLEGCGWTCDVDFYWRFPAGKDKSSISQKEWNCLDFLLDEWDYGYLEG